MPNDDINEELWALSTAVRDAVYAAALVAYENARIDGLCHEGAQECALQAMRALDYPTLISRMTKNE